MIVAERKDINGRQRWLIGAMAILVVAACYVREPHLGQGERRWKRRAFRELVESSPPHDPIPLSIQLFLRDAVEDRQVSLSNCSFMRLGITK